LRHSRLSSAGTEEEESERERLKENLNMDITACHLNGNKLRLSDLLVASNLHFMHDIVGISYNICRQSGKLLNCFSPRYTMKEGK